MTSVSDSDSTYTYGYNLEGDVESVDHQVAMLGQTVHFDQLFDPAGNRTQVAARVDGMTDFTTDYTLDDVNRITRIAQGGAAAPKRVDLVYDAASQFTSVTRYADLEGTKSVVTSTYTWDDDGRLTDLTHGTLATYGWTYDAADRLTHTTSPDGSADYTYDNTDQLTAADYDHQSDESFTYDANGNRTGSGYTTSTNNQTLSDGTYDYTYDDEGNRTSRTEIATGAVTEYTWDHRNRLTQIVDKDAQGVVTGTGLMKTPENGQIGAAGLLGIHSALSGKKMGSRMVRPYGKLVGAAESGMRKSVKWDSNATRHRVLRRPLPNSTFPISPSLFVHHV